MKIINSGFIKNIIIFTKLVEINTVNRWVSAFVMGLLYLVQTTNATLNIIHFLKGLLSIFFILCYVMAINDCFDVEDDKIKNKLTNKKIIITEDISLTDAINISLAMLSFGLIISLFVSKLFFIIVIIIIVLSTLYSVPPIRYKQKFPLSTLGESFGALLPFLSGYVILGSISITAVMVSIFFAIITIYLRFHHEAIFHDVDLITGKKTFAIVYGPKNCLNAGRILLIINLIAFIISYVYGLFSVQFFILYGLYFFFSLGLLIKFFKINIPQYMEHLIEDFIIPIWGFGFVMLFSLFLIL